MRWSGHAPAHYPRPLLRGYRLHTLLCRGTGLPLLSHFSPANVHDAPFARPLLELVVRLFTLRPRVVRLDAGYWGLQLIAWIHAALGTQAMIPWNPKRRKRWDGLSPAWIAEELGQHVARAPGSCRRMPPGRGNPPRSRASYPVSQFGNALSIPSRWGEGADGVRATFR